MAFNTRERLLLVVTLLCVAAFTADRLVIEPLFNLWKTRSARISELEQLTEKGHFLVEREDSIARQWHNMQERCLPVDSAEAEKILLNECSQWEKISGIQMTSQQPRWIQDEESPDKKVELNIAASGDIKSIVQFLHAVETSPLAVKTEDLTISSRDEKGRALSLNLRISGLVLLEEKQ